MVNHVARPCPRAKLVTITSASTAETGRLPLPTGIIPVRRLYAQVRTLSEEAAEAQMTPVHERCSVTYHTLPNGELNVLLNSRQRRRDIASPAILEISEVFTQEEREEMISAISAPDRPLDVTADGFIAPPDGRHPRTRPSVRRALATWGRTYCFQTLAARAFREVIAAWRKVVPLRARYSALLRPHCCGLGDACENYKDLLGLPLWPGPTLSAKNLYFLCTKMLKLLKAMDTLLEHLAAESPPIVEPKDRKYRLRLLLLRQHTRDLCRQWQPLDLDALEALHGIV